MSPRSARMGTMKVVAGRVVEGRIVVGEELPEGAEVRVHVHEAGDVGWDVDEPSWRELDESIAEADRGDGIDAAAFLASLPPMSSGR